MTDDTDLLATRSSRRTLLRGAAVGGAVLWTTPAVQVLSMTAASAETASPGSSVLGGNPTATPTPTPTPTQTATPPPCGPALTGTASASARSFVVDGATSTAGPASSKTRQPGAATVATDEAGTVALPTAVSGVSGPTATTSIEVGATRLTATASTHLTGLSLDAGAGTVLRVDSVRVTVTAVDGEDDVERTVEIAGIRLHAPSGVPGLGPQVTTLDALPTVSGVLGLKSGKKLSDGVVGIEVTLPDGRVVRIGECRATASATPCAP